MLAELTTAASVGILANMRARQILSKKDRFPDGTLAQTIIWEVPLAVLGSQHRYKYSLFFGRPGERLIGYDNERGKGDHRHRGEVEDSYEFVDIDKLLEDFWNDVLAWRRSNPHIDDLG